MSTIHRPLASWWWSVSFHQFINSREKAYCSNILLVVLILVASIYKHGPSNGLVLIYDMKNFTAGHLLRNNLRSMRRFFEFIQEGSPLKIHEIHILNTVPFFHLVMAIIKPFLKAEIAQKVRALDHKLQQTDLANIFSDASSFVNGWSWRVPRQAYPTNKFTIRLWRCLWLSGSLAREDV